VNNTEKVAPLEPPAETAPADTREQDFARHLRRAGELIGAQRLPEGELEILKGLALSPRDLRALKLLALVRFKLGRLAEAREVYRTAHEVAPEDAAVRLNLGLIALKLDWFEEAVSELESATRLAPEDQRAWSYLGYAYARIGNKARAAAAFRRAGQEEVAVEIERATPATGLAATLAPQALAVKSATVAKTAEMPVAVPVEIAAEQSSATGFAFSRLISDREAPGGDGVLHLAVLGEAHVRQSALLAAAGELRIGEAHRRRRGRMTDELLGSLDDLFVRCLGDGEMWLTVPPRGRGLVALSLDQDVLYLREERVVAFDGDAVWESGRVPWDGLPLLQFRGTGRVVADVGRGDVVALRVPEGRSMTVARARLLGWLGRVVVQSLREPGADNPLPHVTCEGEGVLLLSKRVESPKIDF
jgi:tetratricopeptide (TPR) repeat protein